MICCSQMKPVLSYFLSLLLLLLVSGLWLCGCAGSGAGPLVRALASAGPNRSELEKYRMTRTFRAVFDGDPYTSFDYIHPSGGWAGLDLGIPRQVTRIRYAPRNRDNFIREGDRVSVPEGTLYYLRNLTRGHDERIFTIDSETGLQRF